jgi:hypothetical protein
VGGNPGNAFAIDPATGVITVNDATQIDFATTPIYALQVQVSDDGTPGLSDTAVVTIGELPVIVSEPPPDAPPPDQLPPDAPPPDEPPSDAPPPDELPPHEPPPPEDETATPPLPDSSDNGLPVTPAEPVVSVAAEPLAAPDGSSRRDGASEKASESARRPFAGIRWFGNLAAGVPLSNFLSPQAASEFLEELNRLRDEVDAPARAEAQIVGSTLGIASGLSIGYALMLTRGGLLVTSLLSSMPAWRLIDPLPVLARLGTARPKVREEDDESLDSLVRRGAGNRNSEEPGLATAPRAGAAAGDSTPADTRDSRNQP